MSKHRMPTPYEDLLEEILTYGKPKGDRTGTGTISLPFRQMRFNLQQGFPLVTTKKVWTKGIVHELLWMLSGSTNIKYLLDNDVHIWDEWASPTGELGPVYGAQWRTWDAHPEDGYVGLGPNKHVDGIDQITDLIDGLRRDPEGRRHIVTAWNPSDLEHQGLPPCHMLFQMYVVDNELSCHLYQRSADMFLGVPFNIASYALLTHMVAQQTGMTVGEFVWTGGDCHIYNNHRSQVHQQISRVAYPLPTLALTPRESIFDYEYDDIEFMGYRSHPAIKGEVSI